jgi:hypothetical protein
LEVVGFLLATSVLIAWFRSSFEARKIVLSSETIWQWIKVFKGVFTGFLVQIECQLLPEF